ncbi:Zinc finger protein [Quillaja saponaria]|uniref:Zinc finger protein n=1 Tax=Quillaja saponaria TaxID=32244 RepID=A0AAD7PU72_QUISA|nr:Zinc finger protein [Quillaja saponaria]
MAMDVEEKDQPGFPYWKPVCRRFGSESPFFVSGNIERELLAKQVRLFLISLHVSNVSFTSFCACRGVFCPIVGCGACLTSLEGFEDHYTARHTASCSVCSRVYPTSRLLSIHVSEVHDSFFRAKVARGYPMYECLVEGCGLKFKSYKGRQQHLVDKHKFPTSFEFFKKSRLSKKQRQKSQRKQTIHNNEGASSMMEVENETMDGLVSAVSRLSTSDTSPSSISFGRRHTRGLTLVPRAVQQGSRSDTTPARTKK